MVQSMCLRTTTLPGFCIFILKFGAAYGAFIIRYLHYCMVAEFTRVELKSFYSHDAVESALPWTVHRSNSTKQQLNRMEF